MKMVFETYWAVPSVALVFVLTTFASVFLQLFPAPYYLGMILPYVLTANILVIIYQAKFSRKVIVKTILSSIVPLGLGYLWFIQTA